VNLPTNRRGLHSFYLSDGEICGELISLRLDYYFAYAPKSFSPNGDWINDRFTVFGGSDPEKIRSLQVIDRWGRLVYQQGNLLSNDQGMAWDDKKKENNPGKVFTSSQPKTNE